MKTIDELRKLACRPLTYHPQGCIRLTFGKDFENVYHFYSDRTPILVKESHSHDNIHTHPYSFKSTVIKGTIRNHIYQWEESEEATDHCIVRRQCRAGMPWHPEQSNITFKKVLTFDTHENDSYTIEYSVMHKVEWMTPKIITLLEKSQIMQEPTFILPQDTLYTEEELFELKSEEECWDIIEYTLA